jgi:hypothetical protein
VDYPGFINIDAIGFRRVRHLSPINPLPALPYARGRSRLRQPFEGWKGHQGDSIPTVANEFA